MSADELERYRQMQHEVEGEYRSTVERMEELKDAGKVKTATYQQLFARKMTLAAFLDLYRKHGLA